uniref:Uncharacterized protein n=1 Tax=Arundo donax TaxID=35708 RepID=A0A0A9CSC2_ARUDO
MSDTDGYSKVTIQLTGGSQYKGQSFLHGKIHQMRSSLLPFHNALQSCHILPSHSFDEEKYLTKTEIPH